MTPLHSARCTDKLLELSGSAGKSLHGVQFWYRASEPAAIFAFLSSDGKQLYYVASASLYTSDEIYKRLARAAVSTK